MCQLQKVQKFLYFSKIPPSYLEVILPVYMQPMAEHVPHDRQVGVLALHSDSVHTKKLREERVAMAGDDVLEDGNIEWVKSRRRKKQNTDITD